MKNINNLLLIILSIFLTGCITTIAPKPIISKTASFAGSNSNGGLVSTITDNKGEVIYVIINKAAHDNYNLLIIKYGKLFLPKLKEDDGVTKLNKDNYKIDSEHFSKFAQMATWYKEDK